MKIIANWKELEKVGDSKTHKLVITPEDGNGWIVEKTTGNLDQYLSTHTFYGSTYLHSSEVLQKYGFDIQLANWDEVKV